MKHALVGRFIYISEDSIILQLNNKTVHCNCNTTNLLRTELQTPSYLVFWNFSIYLRNVFETPLNDYIWLTECGKFIHLVSREGENKYYIKVCILELYKTINESI